MPWLSLSVEIDAAHAEAFSDALIDAGAIAVSLEDAEAGTACESPMFAEPGPYPGSGQAQAWRHNRVCALAAQECDPGELIRSACAATGIAPPRFAFETVADQDWVRASQAQFAPVRAGDRLWIVPSWHEPPPERTAIVLRLDPGLAFGTGTHASTRLMLGWLERSGCEGLRVLDYGCGSGILAIAAARLGASHPHAVDIDPQALCATATNTERNHVQVSAWLADRLPPGQFDIVLANILANPLIVLAPLLASRTRQAGRIALSGVLAGQAADVMAAYASDFDVSIAGAEDGWVVIDGTRR